MDKLDRHDIASVEISWLETIREVERHINSEPSAKAALERLLKLGCDRTRVVKALFMYCGGSAAMITATKAQLRKNHRFILNLAERLEKRIVPQIKDADRILDEAGFTVYSNVGAVETYAELIKKLAIAGFARAASNKVSGRDQHLRFLAEMVATVTGRGHYKELAELTCAVRFGYTGEICDATAESIGKLVRKLQRQGPIDLCSAQELEEIRESVDGQTHKSQSS